MSYYLHDDIFCLIMTQGLITLAICNFFSIPSLNVVSGESGAGKVKNNTSIEHLI